MDEGKKGETVVKLLLSRVTFSEHECIQIIHADFDIGNHAVEFVSKDATQSFVWKPISTVCCWEKPSLAAFGIRGLSQEKDLIRHDI